MKSKLIEYAVFGVFILSLFYMTLIVIAGIIDTLT